MKKLLIAACILIGITMSAQNNYPTTPASKKVTGTENITGASGTKVNPIATPKPAETTSSAAVQNTGVITNYGKNNDGSSTGTTVTGNGSKADSAPVDDNSPSPANRGGTMIATPRRR